MTTAVILAGGKSSRMGRDKLALDLGGETFLAAAVRKFTEKFDRVFVSVADPEKYPDIKADRICDIVPGCGPMSGLHAALKKLGEPVFLVAADLPLADPDAALRVMSLSEGYDAVVPMDPSGRYEPLFAWYSPDVLPVIEEGLESGAYKMAAALNRMNVRWVSPGELGETWRDGLLSNINRPEDYEKLRASL